MMKLLSLILLTHFSAFAKTDNSKSLEASIAQSKKAIVHVHASWCPSCKQQKKILAAIDQKNFELIEANFDEDKKFLKDYRVFQQSMLIAFKNGKEVKRVFGITKKDKIMTFIESAFKDSLQSTLDAKRAKSKASNQDKKTMNDALEELKKSDLLKNAKSKGDQYINFTLPNMHNKKVTLSEKLKSGPVILTFYRGGWCPYCNLQLRAYQEYLGEFESLGAQLIAVSPESVDSSSETSKKNDLKFEVLTDNLNKVAKKYGLVFKVGDDLKELYLKFGLNLEKNQGNDSWELPIPATYIIDTNGKIVYSFLNLDYVKRAEPTKIIDVLKNLKQ